MKEKRNSSAMGFAAVVILLLVPITAYIAGYFLRCEVYPVCFLFDNPLSNEGASILIRAYPTDFEAQLFRPAARIESALTGNKVSTSSKDVISMDLTPWLTSGLFRVKPFEATPS